MWLALLAFTSVCEGHVKLLHKPYFSLPIRNAATASGDGTLSTSGPCGGSLKWGNRGYSNVTVGDNITLVFAYNGGHQSATQNMIRVAMVCGRLDSDTTLATTTVANVSSPLVNASDSSTAGYDVWVIIPETPKIPNGEYCTISALDVRNWGGCIDVQVLPKPVTPTPAGPPAQNALMGKSVAGVYPFSEAQCTPDSPNCCCVTGTLTVTQDPGSSNASAIAYFKSCNHTNYTRPVNLSFPVTLIQQAPNLASMKGSAPAATNTLSFQVSAGATTIGNTLVMTDDSTIPAYCGLNSKLFATAIANPNGPLGEGTTEQGTAAIVLAVLAVVAVGAACWFFGRVITAKLSGMSSKATPINLGFQFLLFCLSAASLGGEWASGNGYSFSLWSLCGPLATGEGCMDSAAVSTSGSGLLHTVQAFVALGMIVAIISLLVCGASMVYTLGEMTFKVLFVFAVFEVVVFFLAVCFFGGYFNDNLANSLAVSWGYGLIILTWFLAMFAAPFAKLATESKATSSTK